MLVKLVLGNPLQSNFYLYDRAVNRKFFRISVGGDTHITSLKGFRRTYIGSIPGKIIQGFRDVHSSNPLILIDEIDKIVGKTQHGDPSSVLLEILDPEQNKAFVDDYLDLPFDLSKALFLCTANTLYTIPKPLIDRMEIIEVSGYTHEEKMNILNNFVYPQEIDNAGIKGKESEFTITNDAKKDMIENLCREPGVRELQRSIKRIMEKIAFQILKGEKNIIVNKENYLSYVGNPSIYPDRIYPQTPPVFVFNIIGSRMWVNVDRNRWNHLIYRS